MSQVSNVLRGSLQRWGMEDDDSLMRRNICWKYQSERYKVLDGSSVAESNSEDIPILRDDKTGSLGE